MRLFAICLSLVLVSGCARTTEVNPLAPDAPRGFRTGDNFTYRGSAITIYGTKPYQDFDQTIRVDAVGDFLGSSNVARVTILQSASGSASTPSYLKHDENGDYAGYDYLREGWLIYPVSSKRKIVYAPRTMGGSPQTLMLQRTAYLGEEERSVMGQRLHTVVACRELFDTSYSSGVVTQVNILRDTVWYAPSLGVPVEEHNWQSYISRSEKWRLYWSLLTKILTDHRTLP